MALQCRERLFVMITTLQTMMVFDYLVGIGMIIMMLLNDDSNEFVLSVCVWISKQLLLIHFDIEPIVFNSKILFELFDVVRLCFRFILILPCILRT